MVLTMLILVGCGSKKTESVSTGSSELEAEIKQNEEDEGEPEEEKEVIAEELDEDTELEQLAFNDIEVLKADIVDNTDIVTMTENMYSEYGFCFNDMCLNVSEYTDEGYTAFCTVEFTGSEDMLTQDYSLFYKLNEQGDKWELNDYQATSEANIVSCIEDSSDLGEELFEEGTDYMSSGELCGTFVYQKNKFPDNNSDGIRRGLWVVSITNDAEGNYYYTSYILGTLDNYINSVYDSSSGDSTCWDKYPIYYDSSNNIMNTVRNDTPFFVYSQSGGESFNRDFIRISDAELSQQEIVDIWINNYDK